MISILKLRSIARIALVALVAGVATTSQAALVTDFSGFGLTQTVLDFNQFGPGFTFTAGPLEVSNIPGTSVTFTSNVTSVIGNSGYGLNDNGGWNASKTGYAGVDSGSGAVTFAFNDGPVSAVGGFVNYAFLSGIPVGGAAFLEVLSGSDTVLESYDLGTTLPISTPGGVNAGDFRGIVRPTADIAAFRLRGGFLVIDDLRLASNGVVAVPEANTGLLALLGAGCSLLGVRFARKKK